MRVGSRAVNDRAAIFLFFIFVLDRES